MTLQENVLLAPYTTFRIGGRARFFAVCERVADIEESIVFAKKNAVPVFILGGGSNLLISDTGFSGLVIKLALKGIVEEVVAPHVVRVIASAGEDWDSFVAYTVSKNLSGIENLSLIPGTVGATPVQNIGAYGVEVKDTIDWVEVYNPQTGGLERFSNVQCQFKYRDSYFKNAGKGLVVTRVAFILKKNGQPMISYKDLQIYFTEKKIEPTIASVRQAVIEIRTAKLPDIKICGTAGSFFKNPIIEKSVYQTLLTRYPTMPSFPVDEQMVKIPAAWLLDKVCGFKGIRQGNVGVYENQALVLVNWGGATAQEVKVLAQTMIDTVKEKTNISLEREVEYV